MRGHLSGCLAVAILSCAGLALAGDGSKAKRPQLELRASPRVAFVPVEILLTGQLKGGADQEEFYCPALEWQWGDGTRSVHESDCAPFQSGTELERFFSARHAYVRPGVYQVRLTLRRASRAVAVAWADIAVHGNVASRY